MKITLQGIIILFLVVLVSCTNSEKKRIEQGNELVVKIEKFKTKRGCLPDSLEQLGIKETLEGPFFYEKKDSVNYIVYFGTSLGESMIYYSDTKEWDYRLRGMGQDK